MEELIKQKLAEIEASKKKIDQLEHDVTMESMHIDFAEEAIINSLAEQGEIEYEPHSINWYRVICKRALAHADGLREKSSHATKVLEDEYLVRQADALEAQVKAWEKRYCDYSLDIDPNDNRVGNRSVFEKINELLEANANVREIAKTIDANPCHFGRLVEELTPDTPLCAVAAYIVRNSWLKLKIADGEWDDDHKPTDFEELCDKTQDE